MKNSVFAWLFLCIPLLANAADVAANKDRIWRQNGVNNWFKDAGGACAASMTTSSYPFVSAVIGPSGLTASCMGRDNGSIPPKDVNAMGVGALDVDKCAATEIRSFPSGNCIKKPVEEKTCKDSAGSKVYVTVFRGFGSLTAKVPENTSGAFSGFPTQNSQCKFTGGVKDLEVESCDSTIYEGQQRFTCTYSSKSSGEDADKDKNSGLVTAPDSTRKPSNMDPGVKSSNGDCPKGSVGGMVDGVLTCFGEGVNPSTPAKTPTTTSETKTTDANGNEVKTSVKNSTNADGSETKQTTVTTVKPDGSVETKSFTETTKAPTGDNGKEDKPETDFCKSNPSLTICKNSVAKGSCGAVTCQGDAIQCEMLIQQTALRCSAEQDKKDLESSPLNALGKAAASGSDPLSSSLPSPANATNISVPTSLTTSGWLGGGQCFADKSFTVMGKTIALPFGKACDGLVVLRYALMVMASLVSFKILRASFLSE